MHRSEHQLFVVCLRKPGLSNCSRGKSSAALKHKNEAVNWHDHIERLCDQEISKDDL